jgi:predicted  nucleic acid-binding Zn-ribbon protein
LSTAPLDALVALQDADTAIDQLRHRRTRLPERAELAAVDQEADRLRAEAAGLTEGRDEIAGRQAALEAELEAIEARAASVNRRLYGGEVSASRELQALAADVEALQARASAVEDQVLELMEERQPVESRLDELFAQLARLEDRRQVASSRLASAESAIDGEVEEGQRRRTELAAAVSADLLDTYDQLRSRLAGVAVARLVGNHCDGCHLTLPAMELDRIRHLPDTEVVTCDQCGRILVRA